MPKQGVDQALEDLHSILDILDDQTRPLRLHHSSFRDFLVHKHMFPCIRWFGEYDDWAMYAVNLTARYTSEQKYGGREKWWWKFRRFDKQKGPSDSYGRNTFALGLYLGCMSATPEKEHT